MGIRPEAGGSPSRREGFGPAAGSAGPVLRTPCKNRNSHLFRTHAAVRSAMADGLAVDFDDARAAITTEHREDLSDPLPRDIRLAAPEEAGRDRLLAVQEEKGVGVETLEVLLHSIGVVGVQERKTRLSCDGIAKHRP